MPYTSSVQQNRPLLYPKPIRALFRMRPNTDSALIDSLARHVDCLAGLIGARPFTKPAAFEAAATYVERELTNAGYDAGRQTYRIGDREVANIVAERPDGRKKDSIIVVGAH